MKKAWRNALFLCFLYGLLSSCAHSASESSLTGTQIIADHTVVDRYDDIPQVYIDIVNTWLVDIPGESHSGGYRIGMDLLEQIDSAYAVDIFDGSLPAASANLRFGSHGSVGEEDFYTNSSAITSIQNLLSTQKTGGNQIKVLGFGWCWDMTWNNPPGGTIDPVYNVHWAGTSEGGPEGNQIWGLDAADETLTGNSVCMDTYLNAVMAFNAYCAANTISTKVIFTTGPVDSEGGGTENGFQRELKHDYIRAFVANVPGAVLFDYADIMCWSNSGEENSDIWNDGGTNRRYSQIHDQNMMDYDGSWNMVSHREDGDHIGQVGTVRLAKAMWWMLARMAGWNGE